MRVFFGQLTPIIAGLPICKVFELVDDDPNKYMVAYEIKKHVEKEVKGLGYLVVTKPVRKLLRKTPVLPCFH